MAIVELAGQLRSETGKGAAHRIRQEGLIPGIVYGPSEANRMIALVRRSFEAVMRRAAEKAVVIDLRLEGEEAGGLMVLIKEVQRDPVTSELLHVDFKHISMDKPVRIDVPIHLVGTAEGVKTEGGFVDHVLRELEIECLPADIPEFIEVDVAPLHVGDSIHAGEVTRSGVTVQTPPDRVIVAVHGKAAELPTEAAEAEAAAEEEGAPAEEGTDEAAKEGAKEGAPADKGGDKKGSGS